MKKLTGKYGLPLEVRFCKNCTMNNQRPSSTVEFKQTDKEDKVIEIPQMANGGRMGYSEGSNSLRKRVEELMDDGYEFGEAVKQASKELEND